MGISISAVFGLLIILWAAVMIVRAVRIVPQQQAWVIERLGKFHGVLVSGIQIIVPFFDRVAYKFDMREIPMDVPEQVCITKDNTRLSVDGVLYYQITNAQNAAYGTSNVLTAVVQLVQTTMRAEVGKLALDECLSQRDTLNRGVVDVLTQAATSWGVKVLRYEIRNLSPPNARSAPPSPNPKATASRPSTSRKARSRARSTTPKANVSPPSCAPTARARPSPPWPWPPPRRFPTSVKPWPGRVAPTRCTISWASSGCSSGDSSPRIPPSPWCRPIWAIFPRWWGRCYPRRGMPS